MEGSWKYKLWKRLTKSLVYSADERKLFFDNMWHVRMIQQQAGEAFKGNSSPECIVAVQGTHYSGSSAVLGLLQEFDGVGVTGFLQPTWTKSNPGIQQSECCFFIASGFPELIRAFHQGSPEEVDLSIKRFIQNTNRAYKNKGFRSGEFMPLLYGSTFKRITHEYLHKILELDDYTRGVLKERDFPHAAWEDDDPVWDGCTFAFGKGKGRYLNYRFAQLSGTQFREATAGYLREFFSILRGRRVLVFDQLLRYDYLELINQYMDSPIKQICVFRDPRDSYLSALRMDVNEQPGSVADYKAYHLGRRNEFRNNYPHRLIIRFEDLVLNYEDICQKIIDFIGLKSSDHKAKKSVFDPRISVSNIGAYRHYLRPEFMQQLENEMKDCCFDPTNESLSEEALELLKSSGNWNDIL